MKLKFLFALALIFCALNFAGAQTLHTQWHEAKSISGNFKAVSSNPDVEVFSAPGVIMIKVNHETEIRLFTILGKLISSQRLSPGIFEYQLETHGIYVIKTDESSSKIAV